MAKFDNPQDLRIPPCARCGTAPAAHHVADAREGYIAVCTGCLDPSERLPEGVAA